MIRRSLMLFASVAVMAWGVSAQAQTVLKVATQTTAGAKDARKAVMQLITDEVAKANAGVTVKVYYDSELVAASEMWRAVMDGTVDSSFVFLPAIARDIPEINIHGMPGVMTSWDDVKKFRDSSANKQISAVLEKRGVLLLGGYWDAVAVGSTGECIRRPADLDGVVARGPGRPFEAVVESAGAIPVPFPSPEIPRALKTGAVDMVITSAPSMVAGDGHKHLKCVTDTANRFPGMVHTSMLMNKAAFEKLNPAQQAAFKAALDKGAEFMFTALKTGSAETVARMRSEGVKVAAIEEADLAEWNRRAKAVAHRDYAATSPASAAILQAALQAVGRE